MFCDSAFDHSGERHQQGWIIGFTNPHLNANEKAPVSIALWKSRKLARKASSPQLVETFACSYGLADAFWVRCLLWSSLYSDYGYVDKQPAHIAFPIREPTVLRSDRKEIIDPFLSALTDSKGLYDALANELPQDNKFCAPEMPIIEQSLDNLFGRIRWIPHNLSLIHI